jgi:predicted N-acyltransferase
MLQVKKFNSIKEIDQEHWESFINPGDYFHSYQFIRVVEDSRVENAAFKYLVFYDGQEIVSTTVLSAFNISLDLFISNNFLVRKIKQFSPDFFTIKIVACGLPASFGQLNLRAANNADLREVCSLLSSAMKQLAKESGARFMAIKEFRPAEFKRFSFFEDEGFFPGNSIPYMYLTIRWKNFEEYLLSLRHPYRRKIQLSLKKMECSRPQVKSIKEFDPACKKACIVLSDPQHTNAEEWYKMYLGVMGRTTTKLETLNQAFFENLLKENKDLKVMSLIAGGKTISSGILVKQGDSLTFMLAGRENDKDAYDSYFNLVYAIIAYAIESGCSILKLGQTAYWVKQSVGAKPENEYLYFASTSKFWHSVISNFRNVFFPATVLKEIHVFKTNKNGEVVLNAPPGHQQLTLA